MFTVHVRGSLYSDEWHTLDAVTHADFWRNLRSPSMSHPPLYFALAKFGYDITEQPWGIRLPSVLFALATVALAPLAAQQILGQRYALSALWLTATAPFLVEFASEGRPYAMVMFLALAFLYVLWQFTERESWALAALLTATTLAGLATHHLFTLLVAAGGLYYLAVRRNLTRYSSACLALLLTAAATTVPLVIQHATHVAQQTRDWSSALDQFSLLNFLVRLPVALTFGYCTFQLPPLGAARNIPLEILAQNLPLLLATAVWFVGLGVAVLKIRSHRPALRMLVWTLVAPVGFAVVGTLCGLFLVREKYLAIAFPSLACLTWLAVPHLSATRWGKLCVACYVMLVAVSLAHFVLWPQRYSRRSDWQGLTTAVTQRWQPQDALVVYHLPTGRARILWSWDAPRPIDLKNGTAGGPVDLAEKATRLHAATRGSIFLVDEEAMRNGTDPQNRFLASLTRLRQPQRYPFGRNLHLIVLPPNRP